MMDKMHDFSSVNAGTLKNRRTVFDFKPSVKTSFNQGQLIPIYWTQVLPGDTFNFDVNALVRMSAQPLKPVLDDAYIDMYAFFVPQRLLWKHWDKLHGANSDPYFDSTEYIVPSLLGVGTGSTEKVYVGSVLDYLGVSTDVSVNSLNISALPFAAYFKIWNDWFRDENYQYASDIPEIIYNLDNASSLSFTDPDFGSYYCSGHFGISEYVPFYYDVNDTSRDYLFLYDVWCSPVNRYHDYFSSVLPKPQKADPVQLPLGGTAQLAVTGDPTVSANVYTKTGVPFISGLAAVSSSSSNPVWSGSKVMSSATGTLTNSFSTNLVTDLSTASSATIQDFVYALALQTQYIRDNIGGTRYIEMLKANFGVSPLDATLQRPELLGACHKRLNITAVPQTNVAQSSAATINNATGSLGAMSATGISSSFVNKSFTEYGYLMIMAAVRVKHSYSQGIDKFWFDKRRFDYFYPAFSNIGEQPVYVREIAAITPTENTTGVGINSVFGYQEAWAPYKNFPDRITGNLRKSGYSDFAAWTYGDYYTQRFVANGLWLFETAETIGNTTVLGGSPQVALQFIADIRFDGVAIRPVPANTQLRLTDLR